MGRKVKVVTACGEEHFYDYPQEVKSVEIVEEERNLIITQQNDFGGAGHYHIEESDGTYISNIFIDGREIRIYGDSTVKVVKVC